MATKESQIRGERRVSLLALLTAPTEVAQLLVQHSSESGSASAFSEECFAQTQTPVRIQKVDPLVSLEIPN